MMPKRCGVLILILAMAVVVCNADLVRAQACDGQAPYFLFTDSTGGEYAVQVDSLSSLCQSTQCEEIGVFDGDLCVGAAFINDIWPLTITSWADDPVTPEVDGYVLGHQVEFRLYHHEDSLLEFFDTTHSVLGDGTFGDEVGSEFWLQCCATPPAMGLVTIGPNPVCGSELSCLTWSMVVGADYYEVKENDGEWVFAGNVTQRCFSMSAPGDYTYQVRACNDCGCSTPSPASVLSVGSPPAQVGLPSVDLNPVCLGEQYCIGWGSVPTVAGYEIRADSGVWTDVGSSTQACFTGSLLGDHTYEVRGYNGCGEGSTSVARVVTVQLAPIAPQTPNVYAGPLCADSGFCLSWNSVAGATSYELSEDDGAWQEVGNITEHCLTLSTAGEYDYRVRACNSCGCSGASSALAVSVGQVPEMPSTPTSSANPACLDQEFCLTWPATAWAESYELNENGAGWINIGNVTSVCRLPGTAGDYSYSLRALSSCGASSASPARIVTVRPSLPVPIRPVASEDIVCTAQPYCIQWFTVAGATSYQIRQNGGMWIAAGGSFTTCYSQGSSGTFTYEVRGCDDCGCTAPSPPCTVMVNSSLLPPGGFAADPSEVCPNEEYCLTWDAVPGADRYEIRDDAYAWTDLGDTTSHCLSQGLPGDYNYWIRACSDCGCGPATPVTTVAVRPPPPAPSSLIATPNPGCTHEDFCLTWSSVTGAVAYEVREDSGAWTNVGLVTEACLNRSMVGDYLFEVRACHDCGCSEPGPYVIVNIGSLPSVPGAPAVDHDSVCTGQEFCLSWSTDVDATGYQIRENGAAWSDPTADTMACLAPANAGDYTYEVRACNDCGCSNASGPTAVAIVSEISMPASFSVDKDSVCQNEDFCFTWTVAAGADYYEIAEDGGSWSNLGDTNQVCLQRAEMRTFSFVLRACGDCGCSDATAPVSVKVASGMDTPPVLTTADSTVCRGTEFTFIWDPVDDAGWYDVRVNGNDWRSFGDSTSYTAINYVPASDTFEVRACNSCGCTPASDQLVVHSIVGSDPPQNIQVSHDPTCSNREFCLSWDPVDTATQYQVHRVGEPWTNAATATAYCFTHTQAGTYEYEVRSCNACGCGTNSPIIQVTTVDPAEAPMMLNCGVQGNEIRIEWTECEGAEFYRLYSDGLLLASTGNTYRIEDADPGVEHTYHVVAVSDCGETPSIDSCVFAYPTDVHEIGGGTIPEGYALDQNYPNPFNPETQIEFDLPRGGWVRLQVVNVLGRTVRTLVDEPLSAGSKVVLWDGTNDHGRSVSSGVYFYQLTYEQQSTTRKMLLLR